MKSLTKKYIVQTQDILSVQSVGRYVSIRQGDILFGRYKVVSHLGSGGFAQVYLAEHLSLNTYRALKCIRKCQDAYNTARHEADILKNLRHPGIPLIYDVEEDSEIFCIVEEYVSGESVKSFLSKQKFNIRQAVELSIRLCEIVGYLHSKGVFHYDIKPDNIMIIGDDIKLLDYGSAVSENSTEPEVRMGTVGYAAPEMYGKEKMGAGTDIYSLGMILLFLITGKNDVNGLEYVHENRLKTLITSCISHSQGERPGSVKELEMKLKKFLKKPVSDNVSFSISFVGAHPHCGTTHCAFMAADFLKKSGHSVAVCEKNDSCDFLKIIAFEDKVSFAEGAYHVKGICVVPDYKGCAALEFLDRFDYVIHDYGVLTTQNYSEVIENQCVCLVSGKNAYELDKCLKAKKAIEEKFTGKMHTLINFSNGRQYKKIVMENEMAGPLRVPFIPELFYARTKREGWFVKKKKKRN